MPSGGTWIRRSGVPGFPAGTGTLSRVAGRRDRVVSRSRRGHGELRTGRISRRRGNSPHSSRQGPTWGGAERVASALAPPTHPSPGAGWHVDCSERERRSVFFLIRLGLGLYLPVGSTLLPESSGSRREGLKLPVNRASRWLTKRESCSVVVIRRCWKTFRSWKEKIFPKSLFRESGHTRSHEFSHGRFWKWWRLPAHSLRASPIRFSVRADPRRVETLASNSVRKSSVSIWIVIFNVILFW